MATTGNRTHFRASFTHRKNKKRKSRPSTRNDERSRRTRWSCRSEAARSQQSGKSVMPQTYSILSSSSECSSYGSGDSSSSSSENDGGDTLEMAETMADLKKVEETLE